MARHRAQARRATARARHGAAARVERTFLYLFLFCEHFADRRIAEIWLVGVKRRDTPLEIVAARKRIFSAS